MRNNANRLMKRAGFTLIELLVVIAIVAALAAILFPVFASVRERGRRTVCQGNLHQISLAMQQYVQENGNTYPPQAYQGKNADGSVADAVQWQQLIFPYLKTSQVFFCPSAPSDAPSHSSPQVALEATDYTYAWGRLNTINRKGMRGVAETSLVNTTTIMLNTDAGWVTPDDVYHYCHLVPKTSCGRGFTGSTLHSGGGNYSYIDGHVKWLTPEDAGEVECLNSALPPSFKN